MANIKIDEIKFFAFLNEVKAFIEDPNLTLNTKQKLSADGIVGFIEKELKIRELKFIKDKMYTFYKTTYKFDQETANKGYQKYMEAKKNLEKLEREN